MALRYGRRARSWLRVLSVRGEQLGSQRIENTFLQQFIVLSHDQYFEIYFADVLSLMLLTVVSLLGSCTHLRPCERATSTTMTYHSSIFPGSGRCRILICPVYTMAALAGPQGVFGTISMAISEYFYLISSKNAFGCLT
jgi:hypothetical protein